MAPPPDPAQRVALGTHTHQAAWLSDTRAGQAVLAEAYRDRQRPRCLCVPGGVEMYVALHPSGTYYLARMPGSGLLHEARCPSAEPVNLFSGAGAYASGALLQRLDGILTVALDPATRRGMDLTALSLDGLLDLVIETAGVNAWSPGDGERHWPAVRASLLAAAATVGIRGAGPLIDALLVPEPFDKERCASAKAAQETFLSAPDAPRYVCAPLREVKATSFGWLLTLKHLPRTKFWIARAVGEAAEANADGTLSLSAADYPALALAQVRRTRGEGFAVTALALRRTDRRFVPCLTEADGEAADALAASGVAHLRPLRFDLPWAAALCDYALTGGANPLPVFVLDAGGSRAAAAAKRIACRLLGAAPGRAYSVENGLWMPQRPAANH